MKDEEIMKPVTGREIVCPECGKKFTVNEADYASIANQVRNKEFREEVERRVAEMKAGKEAEMKSAEAVMRAEIDRLKAQVEADGRQKELEIAEAVGKKDAEIMAMKAELSRSEDAVKIAVMQERQKNSDAIREKDMMITNLKAEEVASKASMSEQEAVLREKYEQQIKDKEYEITLLKDMRTKLSTKMVGETLEQHCSTLYSQSLRPVMPDAYFEKDNDASEGSKGDFIFRDFSDGKEYVSIMFEMKNEMETTASKHRNEDFLKKLDEDRRAKGCEYAVLVSLLEQDSEMYNAGIVDMSHRYEKMYVIRPQFFIPMITLLVQTSRKNISLQRELEMARSQSVDVTNFENKLREFQHGFSDNYNRAAEYFQNVIRDIDDTIKKLEKTKKDLQTTGNQLRLANNKAAEVSIKKLTRGNPTMKAKFDEARALAGVEEIDDQSNEE